MSSLLRMFCIDFNSDSLGQPATPGLYAAADPAAHVRWCRELGANAIQTFCVGINGYAWYNSKIAPVTPNMAGGDYLRGVIDHGHRAGMEVHGYLCLASNSWYRQQHREETSGIDARKNIPFTTAYLDYFCRLAEEAVRLYELDGILVDWAEEIVPLWIPAEQQMYTELTGRPFPERPVCAPRPVPGIGFGAAVVPGYLTDAEEATFRRLATERAWRRLREAVRGVRPNCRLWLNIPFLAPAGPIWSSSPILREADMMLTERCDLRIARWLHQEMGADKPVLVNLGGLGRYEVDDWRQIVSEGFHLYAYSKPEPATLLPDLVTLPRLATVAEAFRAG